MSGKGTIFLVLGFSLIFMVAGRNFNNMATSTVDNFSSYFYDAKAHQIAASGINLVLNQLFLNNSLADQTFTYSIDGGTVSVVLSTSSGRQIISTSNYNSTTATIKVGFKPSSFAKYAYFSDTEGANIWWTSNDTVWGPFHSNGQLRVADEPVFYGKVTIDGSLVKYSNSAKPHFYGGIETGVHIDIPEDGVSNVASAATTSGAVFSGHSLVYLDFRGDSIRYKFSSSGSWTYKLASTFAPNGVIYAQDAELRIKGNVKGQYTIGVSGTGSNKGKVYIDDDIYYNTNPKTNSSSTDMLGIVAERDVVITDNTANNSNVNIQAAIYCETGSFTAENYQTRAVSGSIYLYGGITQYTRGAVGQFTTDKSGNTTVKNGFSKRYRYDERLLLTSPPVFPGTGELEVVSWFE